MEHDSHVFSMIFCYTYATCRRYYQLLRAQYLSFLGEGRIVTSNEGTVYKK